MTEQNGKIKAVVLHRAGKTASFPVSSDKDAVAFIAEMIVDGFRAAEGSGEVHLFAPAASTSEDWLAGPKRNKAGSKSAIPASNAVPMELRPLRSAPGTVPSLRDTAVGRAAMRPGPLLSNTPLVRGVLAGSSDVVIDIRTRKPLGGAA